MRARDVVPPAGPPQAGRLLSDEYLARVRRVEELPANRSGSDKSWVHRVVAWTEAHHARARAK